MDHQPNLESVVKTISFSREARESAGIKLLATNKNNWELAPIQNYTFRFCQAENIFNYEVPTAHEFSA